MTLYHHLTSVLKIPENNFKKKPFDRQLVKVKIISFKLILYIKYLIILHMCPYF